MIHHDKKPEYPCFNTKEEILNYAFNGQDSWIQAMVRHRIEKDGSNLDVVFVNNYIKKELKSIYNGYEEWINDVPA
jgi:hypothetical protein|tara:strand:+ start:770 stop:997 length:228 start_codon:yes stop_codon:yes gene_type:complete